MGDVFFKLLNMSITAGWLILAVFCVRLVFRKMPKWVNCLLWAVVAIRLIVPFSIESKLSLQPSAEPIKSSTIVEGEVVPYVPSVDSTLNIVESTVNPMLAETFAYQESESVAPLQVFTGIAGSVWLCGMIVLLLFAGVSMVRLHHSVRESVHQKENVYICDDIKSPFILGIIKPKIYLSSSLDEDEMDYIIAHEKAHLRRKDHLWKPLGYLLLCIYWFNPLCCIAYIMLCKDIELACDEKVIKYMSFGDKKEYSRVLLSCATQRRLVFACPLTFGEVGVKERVQSVLNYKRPAFWITLIAVMVGAIVAVCFLTNPTQEQMPEVETQSEENTILSEELINRIIDNSYYEREGFKEVNLTYVVIENEDLVYYNDEPWETDAQRDALAQHALKELYDVTGFQVEECVYTTDGRSSFIFGRSAEAIEKSNAFYTRDYGWMLAGETVPYMGFINARTANYSDIQQLVSPYHDPECQGNGAIPAWFLMHSGIYGGEKLTGFDAVNLNDTVFTHINMKFDGGYYRVVMNEGIESLAEIQGPYYTANAEKDEESETEGPHDTIGAEQEESNVPDTDYQNLEDEVYRRLIQEMTETNVFPATEGIQCSGFPYEYTCSVMDIDGDGKDELLINHSNAGSMAEMALYIYDYDRETGKVYIEYEGWPGITVYDNGYMKENASHNHGRSDLDDFWPYHLFRYNNQTDKYECIANIDAWQYQIAEDIEPDPEFPKDKDLDGDGILYYDASKDDYKPAMIMDNEEYEAWCEQYNRGTKKVIIWYSIISE